LPCRNTPARDFLTALFKREVGKAGNEFQLSGILETMIRINHPGATDGVIETINKFARVKTTYVGNVYAHWIGRLIPQLPRAEALPKLEALLPTLPEKMIDQLLNHVTELKQSTPTAAAT
jgi:hypothetical protein